MIRTARQTLGITQTDLTSPGLSRVYITDLESGKATLSPNIPNKVTRAFQIYKKLIYFSLIKKIPLELDFDELFDQSHEYYKYKTCYEDIMSLESDSQFDILYLNELEIDYMAQNLEDFKIFLLVALARRYKPLDSSKATELYRIALTISKYKINKSIMEYYKDVLYEYMIISNDEANSLVIVDLFEYINQYSEANNIAIGKYVYYNIALHYKKAFNYKKSNHYIELQKTYYPGDYEDYLSNQIIKAGNHSSLGEITETIAIYDELFRIDDKYKPQLLMIYSNAINFIVKHQLDQKMMLETSIQGIESLVKYHYTESRIKHYTFANLAQGYAQLKRFEEAYIQFNNAFKELEKENAITSYSYLMVATESFKTYIALNKAQEILLYLAPLKFDTLSEREKILYMRIIISLQPYVAATHLKVYTDQLKL
jgi:tetratricopeptide (TPR) repeat protein